MYNAVTAFSSPPTLCRYFDLRSVMAMLTAMIAIAIQNPLR
jgi:hypothetical protein